MSDDAHSNWALVAIVLLLLIGAVSCTVSDNHRAVAVAKINSACQEDSK